MFDDLDWNWLDHSNALFDLAFHAGGLWGKCFFVPVESGWSLEECEELLARYGIEIYAKDVIEDYVYFWVDIWDAERALEILTRAGVQVGIVEEVENEREDQ